MANDTKKTTTDYMAVDCPTDASVALAVLTIRRLCMIKNGHCEKCPLSIFEDVEGLYGQKSWQCGLSFDEPASWDLNGTPRPWKAFKQENSQD